MIAGSMCPAIFMLVTARKGSIICSLAESAVVVVVAAVVVTIVDVVVVAHVLLHLTEDAQNFKLDVVRCCGVSLMIVWACLFL